MSQGLRMRSGIAVLIAAMVLTAAYARSPQDIAPRKDYARVAEALQRRNHPSRAADLRRKQ